MDIRRALLLFAVVLGLAALASSIARPPQERSGDERGTRGAAQTPERDRDAATAPRAGPRPGTPAPQPTTVRFPPDAKAETRRLEQDSSAAVLVEVEAPGQVEIAGLGLTQPAEPHTPARFDLLVSRPGRHRIVFLPATSDGRPRRVGTLAVEPARPSARDASGGPEATR